MEGADAFRSPNDVARSGSSMGCASSGLAWRKNRMAGGTGHPGPLSDEGRAVSRALDRAGIIHDMSHLAGGIVSGNCSTSRPGRHREPFQLPRRSCRATGN
jgi:microsomal dipeptidase-like Zn-dependent dipeptidase